MPSAAPSRRLAPGLRGLLLASLLSIPPLHPGTAAADDPRTRELHGIAASCVAFYQAAMLELELPLEPNEPVRQELLEVVDSLSRELLRPTDRKPWYEEHVVRRTSAVATLLQLQPEAAAPKVRDNLDACAGLLPEMKTAAGLE